MEGAANEKPRNSTRGRGGTAVAKKDTARKSQALYRKRAKARLIQLENRLMQLARDLETEAVRSARYKSERDALRAVLSTYEPPSKVEDVARISPAAVQEVVQEEVIQRIYFWQQVTASLHAGV